MKEILEIVSKSLILSPVRCIGFQPRLVIMNEILIFLRGSDRFLLLFIELQQILLLDTIHRLIVTIRKGIQFLLTATELCHDLLRLQGACRLQVDVMRMKGKDADDIIRIGILPMTADGSVVDGQQLDDLHTR